MASGIFTAYSTVRTFSATLPSWVPVEDQERIASYQTYEEIYWNHPETFKLVTRGTENRPVYVPSGRIIVETMNRFFGKALGFRVDPLVGTPADQLAATTAFTTLFARERMKSMWNAQKRFGLIRGDMVFHLKADPTKPQGSRLSVVAVDPASYFPVYDDMDLDKIVRVHILEQYTSVDKKAMVRRLTYEKTDAGITSMTVEMEQAEFAKPNPKFVVSSPLVTLPAEITAFPVYHIKNFEEPGNPFGSSEMRGLEVLMAAINQSVSDRDLALALDGLGVYYTSEGAPVDENGDETDWIMGPGRVIENVRDFNRVQGVGSVAPYADHVQGIWDFMKQASGTPDIAIGNGVDVSVAESGIALSLRMGPIMAKGDEKEDIALDVLANMFFDLKTWFGLYEQMRFPEASVLPIFGDRLPTNRKGEVDLYVALVMTDPPIMSAATARERLAEKGIVFSADEFQRIMQERAAMAEAGAPADPVGDRMAGEAALPDAPSDATV